MNDILTEVIEDTSLVENIAGSSEPEKSVSDVTAEVSTVSEDDLIEEVEDIESVKIEDIYKVLQSISENQVKEKEEYERNYEELLRLYRTGSITADNVSNNQVEYIVSENSILHKPINDYNVQESLSLLMVIGMFCGLWYFIIRKGIYKWR